MIDVERVRADLPAVRRAAYLNTGTFGPLPEPARQAMVAHLAQATEVGRIGKKGIETWLGLMDQTRTALAGTVGATPDEIALTHSTSDGVNLICGGLDWQAGDEVITTDAEHPGLSEPVRGVAERHGVVVRTVGVARGGDALAGIREALSERTRLVAISHVLWTDGRVLPVGAIAEAAHAAGALLLLDGAQGAGCVPVDAPGSGADFYTISGQKWLCGPSGTGGLYVRPSALEAVRPVFPSYFTRNWRAEGGPVLWPAARRLDPGTVTMTAHAGLAASLAWRQEVGWEDGFERAAVLAATLRGLLADVPGVRPIEVDVPSPIVSFDIGERSADAASAVLEEAGVLVRSVPTVPWLRASVGPWNDEGDLERLVAAVAALPADLPAPADATH